MNKLQWKVTRGGWYCQFPGGTYWVKDATVWEHSRPVKNQTEALIVSDDGLRISLGFFELGRDAIQACEDAERGRTDRWREDMEAGAIG